MTALQITPNWKNKTAKFKGTIAAGEHVAVSIANDDNFIADTTNLRLRVVNPANGKTLAQFPMPETADDETDGENEVLPSSEIPAEGEVDWASDLTPLFCILNLNTAQMLKAVPPAANMPLLFVLDAYKEASDGDPGEFTLYFKDMCEVMHWPRRTGEEEPTDLDNYKDIIADFDTRLTAAEQTVADAAANAQSAANSASAAANSAATASTAATDAQTGAIASKNAAQTAANDAASAKTAAEDAQNAAEAAREAAETAQGKAQEYAEAAAESAAAFVVDDTLSVEGAAADAKAVGEANQDLITQIGTVQGNLNAEVTARETLAAAVGDNRQNLAAEIARAQSVEQGLNANKADKATTYTKSEVDAKVAGVRTFQKLVVNELPDAEAADDKTIYLVPRAGSETPDLCDEYVTVGAAGSRRWEKIGGGTAVDLTLDNTVTRTSTNGVKSSGIWSAIWGALTALPGFSSLHDWCVAQLAGKASTADATLTPIYSFSEWTFSGTSPSSGHHWEVIWEPVSEEYRLYDVPDGQTWEDTSVLESVVSIYDALDTVVFPTAGVTATRTRTDIIGYTLGDQSDKPLQPKGDYALLSDIYAAVRQIAPDFTAKVYVRNELCSYNGVVYRCKNAYTATASSTKPNADTTHWEAKKVSELFLGNRGNQNLEGSLSFWNGILTFDFEDAVLNPVILLWNGFQRLDFPMQSGTLALTSDIPSVAGLAPLASPAFTGTPTAPTPASGDNSTKVATTAFVQNAIGGITPGPDNTKLDATSAAPAFSTSSTYAVDEHCTYNGKLYRCTTAVTVAGAWDASNWTADTMTDPDAVLDITSQNQLRVVAKDGTVLWAQGYDLASTSSATLACDAVNNFTFADGATTQAFTLPTAPTGKVGDFILDIDNSVNTGAATMTLTGLDTAFSVVVPEGESLTDMLAIAAGELARFYITLSTFRVNNLPTWHIVKQVVENGGAQS